MSHRQPIFFATVLVLFAVVILLVASSIALADYGEDHHNTPPQQQQRSNSKKKKQRRSADVAYDDFDEDVLDDYDFADTGKKRTWMMRNVPVPAEFDEDPEDGNSELEQLIRKDQQQAQQQQQQQQAQKHSDETPNQQKEKDPPQRVNPDNSRHQQSEEKQEQRQASDQSNKDNTNNNKDSDAQVTGDNSPHEQETKAQNNNAAAPDRRAQHEEDKIVAGGDDGQEEEDDAEPLLLMWYAPMLSFGGYTSEALEFISGLWRVLLPPFDHTQQESLEAKPDADAFRRRYTNILKNLSVAVRGNDRHHQHHNRNNNNNNNNNNKNTNPPHRPFAVKSLACFHHGDSVKTKEPDVHAEEFLACALAGRAMALSNPAIPEQWSMLQPHPSRMIVVCHSNQGMWSLPRADYPGVICPPSVHPVRARVGRTMFESDRVPKSWRRRLLLMDEIWVPTKFHQRAFSRSDDLKNKNDKDDDDDDDGMAIIPVEKLRVIPEPIDTELWRRDDTEFSLVFAQGVVDPEECRVPTEMRMTRNRLAALTVLSGVDVTADDGSGAFDPGPAFDIHPGENKRDADDDDDADERHKPQIATRENVLDKLLSVHVIGAGNNNAASASLASRHCINSKIFVSTFKHERRKGWDILVRAYLEAFSSSSSSSGSSAAAPPCLILHSTMKSFSGGGGGGTSPDALYELDMGKTLDLFATFLYSDERVDLKEQERLQKQEVEEAVAASHRHQHQRHHHHHHNKNTDPAQKKKRVAHRHAAAEMALLQRDEMAREIVQRPTAYRDLCRSTCIKEVCEEVCDKLVLADHHDDGETENQRQKQEQEQEEQERLSALWRRFMRGRIAAGDTPRFLFTSGGGLSFHDYRSLIANSDVNVLPTRGEGWGRPVQEAMALSVPSIVTDWSGPAAFSRPEFAFLIPIDEATQLREVVEPEWFAGHKFAEPSVDDVRNTLLRAEAMPLTELRKMGARARAYVVKHLDSTVVARQVMDAAEELAERMKF